MLYYSGLFLFVTLMAVILGFFVLVGAAAMTAKVFSVIFLIVFVLSLPCRRDP